MNMVVRSIAIEEDSPFSLANIPFGVVSTADGQPVCASALGDYAINLRKLEEYGCFSGIEGYSGTPFSKVSFLKFSDFFF